MSPLGLEKASCLWRCLQFRGVLIERYITVDPSTLPYSTLTLVPMNIGTHQSVLNIESGADKSVQFRDVYRAYCANRPIHMINVERSHGVQDSAPISGCPVF